MSPETTIPPTRTQRPTPVSSPPPIAKLRGLPTCVPSRVAPAGDPFSAHKIFNHLDRLTALVRGENPPPVTLEIDPSNRCNHRCEWCVSVESHTGEMLALADYERLVAEARQMGVRSVVIKGGGEPTLHRQIDAMLRAVANHNLALGLITNGALPWPSTPATVLETCDWIRISLDAATREMHRTIHGVRDFDRILRIIVGLTENRTRTQVGLNFVVEPRNHAEVLAFTKLGATLGVDYVSIRCVFDPTRPLTPAMGAVLREQSAAARALQTDNFRVFLGDFTEEALTASPPTKFPYRRCLAPNLIGVVGAEGNVYPCCFLRGHTQHAFGRLDEQSFEQIWNGPRRQAVMNAIYEGACGHICLGGMTRSRYKLYNGILDYMTLERKTHGEFI